MLQMFPDYDLQWTDQVPIKGKPYHQDLVVKSELLGIILRYHFFAIMSQDFMMVLGNWTTARKDQAPDFLFMGNSFTFPDDSDEYQDTYFMITRLIKMGLGYCRNGFLVHRTRM